MKEIWTADPIHIRKEIETLINNKTPLYIFREDFSPQPVFVRELLVRNANFLILLGKAEQFKAPHEVCFFFYRPVEFATRGFYATPIDETVDSIYLLVPHEVHQFQRRKHLHIETPESSTARFTTSASVEEERGIVLDVSLGGALVHGIFSPLLQHGETIYSLFLSLSMINPRVSSLEVRIHEAIIKREIQIGEKEKKIAISYELHGKEKDDMENYIDLRIMEKRFISR